jgi:hypothetical protein
VFPASRPDFVTSWCTSRKHRRTAVVRKSGKIRGYGTIRRCYDGYKIGPLFAADADSAARCWPNLVRKPRARGCSSIFPV